MFRFISFHPKLAAGLDAFFAAVLIWWLPYLSVWWTLLIWFAFRLTLSGLLAYLVYYPESVSRSRHFLSNSVFTAGLLLLLIFVEWNWSWYLLSLIFIAAPAFSFWLLPSARVGLSFKFKPYRRWLLLLNTLGLFGIWSGFGAIISFQVFALSPWFWLVLGAGLTTAVSFWWWREYKVEYNNKFKLWLAVLFLLMLELVWVVTLWPLGYLASGLLLTWFWYNLWLLIRFHLSKEGIIWKKQVWTLATSGILVVLFLILVARWK